MPIPQTFFALLFAFVVVGSHASAAEPADAAQRQADYLHDLLNTDPPKMVATLRIGCVRGTMVKSYRDGIRRGEYWKPDAVDQCVTLLTRHGRDGTLDGIYRTILMETVGNDAGAGMLAAEIGSYVLDQNITQIPLARGVALPVSSALAFDAGFTNGYRDSSKAPESIAMLPQEAALKPLVERCLDLKEEKAQGCYSAGYVYGLRAQHGKLVAAAR